MKSTIETENPEHAIILVQDDASEHVSIDLIPRRKISINLSPRISFRDVEDVQEAPEPADMPSSAPKDDQNDSDEEASPVVAKTRKAPKKKRKTICRFNRK